MSNLIVDGPYLAHRSYGAPYRLTTSKGLDATLIHSFFRTLNSLRKKFKPETVFITWESHGTKSWRRLKYPSYKPSRNNSIGKEYWSGIRDTQILASLFGVKQYYSPSNEADDVIATLVKKNNTSENIIYTVDKDLMQLVDNRNFVWDGKELYDRRKVFEKFCVYPNQIPDLLAIWGDVSDNIDGIIVYGKRKSAKILEKYNSVENIPENHTIHKYLTKLIFNKELTTLNRQCSLEKIPSEKFSATIDDILDKYELESMKENVNEYKLLGNTGEIDKWLK